MATDFLSKVKQEINKAENLKSDSGKIQIHGDKYEIDFPGPIYVEDCIGNRFDIHVGPVYDYESNDPNKQAVEYGIWISDEFFHVVFSRATFEAVVDYVRGRFDVWENLEKCKNLIDDNEQFEEMENS